MALVGRLRATGPVFSFRTRSDRPVRGRVDGFGKTVHHERGSEVTFTNAAMRRLMATPQVAPQESAEQANLCLEERISPSRRAVYERIVGSPGDWRNWWGDHLRYVQNEVRRRNPLSAAFSAGEPSLRPGIEPNQYLYRVERIDRLLRTFDTSTGGHVEAADVDDWISVQRSVESSNDTIFGSAHPGGAYVDPRIDALQELTDLLNEERSDGRPSFVSFETENPAPHRPGWAEHFCERYGLAHFFTNSTVTLALFRYRVQEVLDGRTDAGNGCHFVRGANGNRPADGSRVLHCPAWHGLGTRGMPEPGNRLQSSCRGADPCQDRLPSASLGCRRHVEQELSVGG